MSFSQQRPLVSFLLTAAVLIVIASLADPWAYTYLNFPGVYEQNWGRLLRIIGYLPFWLLAAIAFYRIGTSATPRRQALLLVAAPALSGALSELLKLLIRRERPRDTAGAYLFRPFVEHPFSTGPLGMPSGDATVAFAAAVILARLWPRARGIWYGLAVGCALARVAARAHFLSDVTVGALLGYATGAYLWHRFAVPVVSESTTPAVEPVHPGGVR